MDLHFCAVKTPDKTVDKCNKKAAVSTGLTAASSRSKSKGAGDSKKELAREYVNWGAYRKRKRTRTKGCLLSPMLV